MPQDLQGLPPAAASVLDGLMQGAVDLHHHGYPEFALDHPTRQDDLAELRHAEAAGMAAIVFKSHFFPTTGVAWRMNRELDTIQAIPSITLNPSAGGLSPLSVEVAARQGARVVYMPTWSSANDLRRGGVSRYLARRLGRLDAGNPDQGLSLTDGAGRLRTEVQECLSVAAEFGMLVATGHVSAAESLALTRAGMAASVPGVMVQHPDNPSVGVTREEMRELAAAGATLEFCAMGFLPAIQRMTIPACIEVIREVGIDRVVLSTDCFFDWMPPCAELLRMTLGSLVFHGLSPAEARSLVVDTPRRLLRMPPAA